MIDPMISITVGALLTLGMYTFPFKPGNYIFRIVEAIYLGVTVGWTVVTVLWSLNGMLVIPLQAGDFTLVIPLLLGFLLYFVYTTNYRWVARYGTVFAMAPMVAFATRMNPARMLNTVRGVIKPLMGGDAVTSIINTYGIVVFVLILGYFIFTLQTKPGTTAHSIWSPLRRLGRLFLMMILGAYFVSWGTKRFALVTYRVVFLVDTWIKGLIG